MMDAHDNYHISSSSGDYERTIGISTVVQLDGADVEIKTTDFDITPEESQKLYDNGVEAEEIPCHVGLRQMGCHVQEKIEPLIVALV